MKANQNNPQTGFPERLLFYIRTRLRSIQNANAGFRAFWQREPNTRIHLACTLLVAIGALLLNVSRMEAVALVLVTGFVWAAELFNTAIEKIMDHLSPDRHPAVQFIKDVAAAAVWVAALTALLTGAFVFTPKIFSL